MNRIPALLAKAPAVLAASALVALGLTGCAESTTDQVAILSGVRANSAAVPEGLVRDAIASIDADGDRVSVVTVEGTPRVVLDLVLSDVPSNSLDRKEYLGKVEQVVLAAVAKSAAVVPEADPAEAFALAVDTFGTGAGTKTIVALDSLLATTGGFAMTDGRLYDDPVDRATALHDAGGIRDMTGIVVEAPRLGVVTAPQSDLDSVARTRLREQWTAFFAAANATFSVESGSLVATPQPLADLPSVTPVELTRLEPVVSSCRSELTGRSVSFVGDKPEFLDPSAAAATIATLAAELAGCPGDILVEASTSSARGQDVNLPLSEDRGHRVAGALAAALGIPVGEIAVIGYGSEWPCRLPDRDAAGNLISDAAAANRVVVVSRGTSPGAC